MVKVRLEHHDGTWTRVDDLLERDPTEMRPNLCMHYRAGVVRIVEWVCPQNDDGAVHAIVQHIKKPRAYKLPTNITDTTWEARAEAALTYRSTLRGRAWPNNSSRDQIVEVHCIPLADICKAIDNMAESQMLTVSTKPPAGIHGCTKCRGSAGGCHRCLSSVVSRMAYTPPTPIYVIE